MLRGVEQGREGEWGAGHGAAVSGAGDEVNGDWNGQDGTCERDRMERSCTGWGRVRVEQGQEVRGAEGRVGWEETGRAGRDGRLKEAVAQYFLSCDRLPNECCIYRCDNILTRPVNYDAAFSPIKNRSLGRFFPKFGKFQRKPCSSPENRLTDVALLQGHVLDQRMRPDQ